MSDQPPTILPEKYRYVTVTPEQDWIMPLVCTYNDLTKSVATTVQEGEFCWFIKIYSTAQRLLKEFKEEAESKGWNETNFPEALGKIEPDDGNPLIDNPFIAAWELQRAVMEIHPWLQKIKDGEVATVTLEESSKTKRALQEALEVNENNGWDS